jgi:hypothetical protein
MHVVHTTSDKLYRYMMAPVRATISLPVVMAVIAAYAGGLLAPASVQAAQCPNEAVRLEQGTGSLPECRGYELASNFSKQGSILEAGFMSGAVVSGPAVGISEDGRLMSLQSSAAGLGVFGQERRPAGSFMFLHRNEGGGWNAEPLNPPQSQFSDQQLVVSDANTGMSLWLLHTSGTGLYTGDLYVRSSTGQFKLIGPLTPSGPPESPSPTMVEGLGSPLVTDGVVGASREFTHIVLQANPSLSGRFLWPVDTTFAEPSLTDNFNQTGSLYEYVGEANREPILVGVENGAGNTELIGRCGTALGTLMGKGAEAPRKKDRTEISENGDVVFFAPVAKDIKECGEKQPEKQELYVRIDQSETVDISEPNPGECGADAGCITNADKSADAEFEAASTDGSKVFFTSTQQLLPGATEDAAAGDSAMEGCSKTTGAGGCNLYEYYLGRYLGLPSEERCTKNCLRLVSAGGPHGAEVQRVIASSNDGSHVYFVAKGDLTGTEENGAGQVAVEGKDNLYVYEPNPENSGESIVTFIATLSPEDAGRLLKAEQPEAQATPDGDFLAFESRGRLTKDDTSNASQLFEYDALNKTLVRVSISEKIEGASYEKDGNTESELESPAFGSNQSISNNGTVVIFESTAALSPYAKAAFESACRSVYEYSWGGSQSITEGEVHLVSDGKDVVRENGNTCGATDGKVDGSGQDVIFSTSDPLTWEDGDTLRDFYDARVNGGRLFPAQAIGCAGDGCQQSPVSPQVGGVLASELARGGENITAATPPPLPGVKPKPKLKALTRAQKLANALKACKKKPKKGRSTCEKRARKLYGSGRGK